MNKLLDILELRKEKSRDAARSRRGKENYEFYELAKLLPLPAAITSQLDKASIIRLSISYLKLREFSGHGDPPWCRDGPPPNKSVKGPPRRRPLSAVAMEIFETHQGTHILQSLDGFAFALANDGRFLYVSETVSIYLGLSQVEMAGSSIFDYVHHQDQPELAEQLGIGYTQSVSGGVPSPGSTSDDGSGNNPRVNSPPLPDRAYTMNPSPEKGTERSFCLRMKSTLTKRGVHTRSAGYRVVNIVAHFRPQISFSMNRKHTPPLLGVVALALALPPPTITELRIERDTFITRLNPDFKVIYCEPILSELMDWTAEDWTNKPLYYFCHPADLNKLRKSHIDLLAKGQVMSEYYRLMNKNGGYVWVQTCATTLYNSKAVDDQSILAINYVLSGVEYKGCVMGLGQLETTTTTETDHSDNTDHSEQGSEHGDGNQKDNMNWKSSPPVRDPHDESLMERSPGAPEGFKHSSNQNEAEQDGLGSGDNGSKTNDSNFMSQNERTDGFKQDCKISNSRRKTDKPKKRKKDPSVVDDGHVDEEFGSIAKRRNEDSFIMDIGMKGSGQEMMNHMNSISDEPNRSPQAREGREGISPPIPEDLSLKTLGDTSSQNNRGNLQRNGWSNDVDYSGGMASSSVRELEEVMNKHLPNIESGLKSSDLSLPSNFQKQKSTIQWIGSQHNENEVMPASNLLRTLYANRESVIRSNARQHCFNEIQQVNMLTPPGTDSYKEQVPLNIPQLTLAHRLLQHDTAVIRVTAGQSPVAICRQCFQRFNPFFARRLNFIRTCSRQTAFILITMSSTTDYDSVKSAYHNMAYHNNAAASFPQYAHSGNGNSVISYDTRSPGSWYSTAYSS
ncbi:hypothetical protein ScPMuIL_014886 [Solemya velum]